MNSQCLGTRVSSMLRASILGALFAGSALAAENQDPQVAKILQAERSFDRRFRSVRTEYRKKTDYREAEGQSPSAMRSRDTSFRATWQDDWYRWEMTDVLKMIDGKSKVLTHICGYDGHWTRVNSQGSVGNVSDQRMPVYPAQKPRMLAAPEFGELCLADVLELRKTNPPSPAISEITRITTRLGKPVQVNDVACVSLRSEFYSGDKAVGIYHFALAPDRNFIVARTQRFAPGNDAHPESSHEVVEWSELSDGVWAPKKVLGDYYTLGASSDGAAAHVVPFANEETTVEFVNLKEAFDPSYFADVALPSKGTVYQVRGGAVVGEDQPGFEPPAQRRRIWSGWYVIAVVNVAWVVAIAIYIARKRLRLQ